MRARQYWRLENMTFSMTSSWSGASRNRRKAYSWWRAEGQRFDCAPWIREARSMAARTVYTGVEKELTGRETEPHEIIYFKVYKSQIPAIEQALEEGL
jgi:hypothetical protein